MHGRYKTIRTSTFKAHPFLHRDNACRWPLSISSASVVQNTSLVHKCLHTTCDIRTVVVHIRSTGRTSAQGLATGSGHHPWSPCNPYNKYPEEDSILLCCKVWRAVLLHFTTSIKCSQYTQTYVHTHKHSTSTYVHHQHECVCLFSFYICPFIL